MELVGKNVYRVHYKLDEVKDVELKKLVVAYSEKEAMANIRGKTIAVTLLDAEVNLVIPNQYLKEKV